MAKKAESLISQDSLDELLNIAEGMYEQVENEEEGESENKADNSDLALSLYSAELIPQKVDAVAWIIEQKGYQLKAEKEYIDKLKKTLDRQTKAFERLKKFFAYVMLKHGKDTDNRLSGITNALWYKTTKAVDEEKLDDIPDTFKTATVKLPLEEWNRIKKTMDVVTQKVEITVDKTAVKDAVEAGTLDEKYVKDNYHLSVGKALGSKKKAAEVQSAAPF